MVVTLDDIQVVRRAWDLNLSHCKVPAIRHLQKLWSLEELLGLGVKVRSSNAREQCLRRSCEPVGMKCILSTQPWWTIPLWVFYSFVNSCSLSVTVPYIPHFVAPTGTLMILCLQPINPWYLPPGMNKDILWHIYISSLWLTTHEVVDTMKFLFPW